MTYLKRYYLIAVLAALFCAPGFSQTPDPPYDHPNAQAQAELRFGYSMLGMMPPPVGWLCAWEPMEGFPVQPQYVRCEPAFMPVSLSSDSLFDPDPSLPNAQRQAEYRYIMSNMMIGFLNPPIGWICTTIPSNGPWPAAHCEPDPALTAERELVEDFNRKLRATRSRR